MAKELSRSDMYESAKATRDRWAKDVEKANKVLEDAAERKAKADAAHLKAKNERDASVEALNEAQATLGALAALMSDVPQPQGLTAGGIASGEGVMTSEPVRDNGSHPSFESTPATMAEPA